MKKYLKALGAFIREFHDITEHARTGRRPAPPKPHHTTNPGAH